LNKITGIVCEVFVFLYAIASIFREEPFHINFDLPPVQWYVGVIIVFVFGVTWAIRFGNFLKRRNRTKTV